MHYYIDGLWSGTPLVSNQIFANVLNTVNSLWTSSTDQSIVGVLLSGCEGNKCYIIFSSGHFNLCRFVSTILSVDDGYVVSAKNFLRSLDLLSWIIQLENSVDLSASNAQWDIGKGVTLHRCELP